VTFRRFSICNYQKNKSEVKGIKMKAIFLLLVLGCAFTYGQDDPAAAAAQQAQQAAQQAQQTAQQAQQTAQQALDQATITSQQTTINNLQVQQNLASASSPSTGPIIGSASQPTFSVKPGKVNPGTQLRIKSATHYATIHYTTDGWTPTADSPRYTDPITIDADTHLQAIAFGPNMLRSPVAYALYSVAPPPEAAEPEPVLLNSAVLPAGTTLRLVTSAAVSSQNAEVGDRVALQLDQDLKFDGNIMVAKGTPVEAVLTVADPATKHGAPGDLVFEVHSIEAQGMSIPLDGGETLEGSAGRNPTQAVIEPGMVVIATVTSDTPVQP
jgi:hypothetical protein